MKKRRSNPMVEVFEVDMGSSAMQMEDIRQILQSARYFHLELEVIWSALIYAKKNPGKEIHEILTHAYQEWVK